MSEPSSTLLARVKKDLSLIEQHPRVQDLGECVWNDLAQSFLCLVTVAIDLPSRKKKLGISCSGVKQHEPITLSFPSSYPIHAPKVYLRQDFPRSLPHINPGDPDKQPQPCIVEGDIDELFHAEGIWFIFNQIVTWLQKAALNGLIDPAQGWEPIRRDFLEDIVAADLTALRNMCSKCDRYYFLDFSFWRMLHRNQISHNRKLSLLGGQISGREIRISLSAPESLQRQLLADCSIENFHFGRSLAILATPGKASSGKTLVSAHYEPETVTDLSSLYRQAEKYGCQESVSASIKLLERCSESFGSEISFPIVVIFSVKRPYALISESSDIELIPYWLDIHLPNILPQKRKTPVYPIALHQAISKKLLQSFSENTSLVRSEDMALLGCGSLGSKIAVHMARSGYAPGRLIDKGVLGPHNAARHALLPEIDGLNISWTRPKAFALQTAIASMSQETKAFQEDVSLIVHDSKLRRKLFPNKIKSIINATASMPVREALASLTLDKLQARVIEASLFSTGKVGLLTLEGAGRNPNTLDLLAQSYQLMCDDLMLSRSILQAQQSSQYQSIGQGCGSLTMRISDAIISLLAASMTQGITQFLENRVTQKYGKILLGTVSSDGMSLAWKTHDISPSHIIPTNALPWTVRLTDRAHQKIKNEYEKTSGVETGGILMGRVSVATHSFLVTDTLPAPDDSLRSPDKFILGIAGIDKAIEEYETTAGHTLYCLGTWHSHLKSCEPSAQDLKTADLLGQSQIRNSVMLIYTPHRYSAILATDV